MSSRRCTCVYNVPACLWKGNDINKGNIPSPWDAQCSVFQYFVAGIRDLNQSGKVVIYNLLDVKQRCSGIRDYSNETMVFLIEPHFLLTPCGVGSKITPLHLLHGYRKKRPRSWVTVQEGDRLANRYTTNLLARNC